MSDKPNFAQVVLENNELKRKYDALQKELFYLKRKNEEKEHKRNMKEIQNQTFCSNYFTVETLRDRT